LVALETSSTTIKLRYREKHSARRLQGLQVDEEAAVMSYE
jgi:hypothetical protein